MVCSWIGNTAAVAREHYLRVTDAHFERAAGMPAGGADVMENVREADAESDAPATHFPTPQAAAAGGADRHNQVQPLSRQRLTPAPAAGRRAPPQLTNPRQGLEP